MACLLCFFQIDPLTGEVFYPESLTQREVKNQIRKTSKLAKEFSLAKITAPYNGVEVFGKEYRNRMKACKRLDEEFVQELRTNHPKEYSSSLKKWQPYEPRRRPNTKRTIVRETVKELTFENPMDYLNYIMKRKNIPSNLFERQGRLECSTYMALEPAEMRDDESTFGGTAICDGNSSGKDLVSPAKNRVDSNNSSPCNPEERSSSRMATAGSSPRSRKRRHSGGETAESPTITLTFSAGLWNEKLLEIAKSYEDAGIKGKKTILGFDVHEFSNMVDSGMKEDRRAMAAAKSRNRTLKSGYFV
ncbi:unnamed protein product [Heligmosomoides polygyrus]|uniref:HA domain-containing protein n=1 Tax=Heligmosomoides polygyrus TaxID=6339 RepID=A0A3P8B0U4_HELPZ|nr:unnamed protein product [Heligmosomoides polygyrus]